MILVTGGLGFIGSAYIWYLNRKGIDNILIYDRFRSQNKWKNVRNLKFQDVILSDLDLKQVEKYNLEAIIHLGACSATTEKNMDFLFCNNYELSKQLWYLAAGNQIPFIYASSAATYGDGKLGFNDEMDISKLVPLNKYGYSKQLFDLWVKRQQNQANYIMPPFFAGLKFFNVFGPNEYHKGKMVSVVYSAYQQIKKTGKINLFKSYLSNYKNGEQKRDFVYVKDVCEFMENLRLNSNISSGLSSGIYNVGSGIANTFLHLAEATFKALNLPPKIEFIDMPQEIINQYQYYTKAIMTKHQPTKPIILGKDYFADAISDYITNYLEKENGYLNHES